MPPTPNICPEPWVIPLNDQLTAALENIGNVVATTELPPKLRDSLWQVALDLARLQGVTEWLSEGMVVLK